MIKMNKMTKFLISVFALFMIVVPIFALADFHLLPEDPILDPPLNTQPEPPLSNSPSLGLVQCGKTGQPGCTFNDIVTLINKVINFILVNLVIPIAAVMFFYAGFELITSGGSTEKRGTAKKVFTNAVIGLVIAVACWLIVKTLLSILGYNDIGLFF